MFLTLVLATFILCTQAEVGYTPKALIDTHHHFVPDFYAAAVAAEGGDPSGWPVPSWNVSSSQALMFKLNISAAILSLTSPGAVITRNNVTARALARQANKFCNDVRAAQPQKFGCFAALPNLLDTNGTLAEIEYALDILKLDGVTLFTRYGDGNHYLGHEEFIPIWQALNQRKAVVFIHPTTPADNSRINPLILGPVIDYPHETTRTALDMIISGTRRKFPNTTVILSHAGGNLPWMLSRVDLYRKGLPRSVLPDGVTYDEFQSDFRSFHYDLALSSSPEKLDLLLDLVPEEHILYGEFDCLQASKIIVVEII
ncbi:amidohydrolase-like protein [Aureobasidium subglaciale]|nr:amidohydrolase-like protein [Aureobasidium subglaciale]KAI5213428.1 amidohydrolase-like protein [Aureobasidium subglaciale]KAI5214983.1 amidohydrolase-like protein [Aureobasidium subglaciale]KAI5253010.1 amidohydrolase-like protein [Aureobasidium subglaciale]